MTGAGLALPLLGAGGAQAADGATWDKVAQCESGGMWSANEGNGYYGGLQLTQETWEQYGGSDYAERPDYASRSQQIAVAEKILAKEGPSAFPNCALDAGLTEDSTQAPDVDPGDSPGSGTPSGEPTQQPSDDASDGTSGGSSDGASGDATGGTSDEPAHPAPEPGTSDTAQPTPSPSTPDDTSDPGTPGTPDDSASPTSPSTPDDSASPSTPPTSPAPDDGADGKSGDGKRGDDARQGGTGDQDRPGDPHPGGTGKHRGSPDPGERAGEGHPSRGGSHGRGEDREAGGKHRVRGGESLSSIAAEHGVKGGWPELYKKNKGKVGDDPDLILPGQKLTL
ncbi:transglycosylase family protein [Streptomyces sp. ODS28]|uniref:transglycosylase family protein n=1 Tax=Streptomyces sp. ODS28 TaxID=3136688 RepID=UPI0031EC7C25